MNIITDTGKAVPSKACVALACEATTIICTPCIYVTRLSRTFVNI